MARVRFDHVTKAFGDVIALRELDLEVYDGEFLVLVGPSGCGKSTALRLVAGLEEPTDGRIFIGDRVVNELAPKDRDVAMVFQSYALYPHMTVAQNLAFGLKLRKIDKSEVRRGVQVAATTLGLEDYLERKPGGLSGGQRQAVAVARAAFWATKAMLMDEPTAALGVRESTQVLKLARSIADRGLAVVLISHILPHVTELADRIVVMRHGRKVAELTEDISSERLVRLIVGIDAEDVVGPQRHRPR